MHQTNEIIAKYLSAVVLLMMIVATANGQAKRLNSTQQAKAERELRNLEREWLAAGRDKNVAAMQRILADDFTITFADGSVRDKAEVIRRLRSGAKNPNEFDWTEDSKIRIYGDAAIITGKYIWRLRDKEKETISESRYTDTYMKLRGRWQVVASHLSHIEKR